MFSSPWRAIINPALEWWMIWLPDSHCQELDTSSFQALGFLIPPFKPVQVTETGSTAAFSPCMFINLRVLCGKRGRKTISREKEGDCNHVCVRLCTFALSQQPLLNVSLAQNHQFNLATILFFSGVHDSSLYLSWQSERLNFPEW